MLTNCWRANRAAADLSDIIKRHPVGLAALLQTTKEFSTEDIARLARKCAEGEGQVSASSADDDFEDAGEDRRSAIKVRFLCAGQGIEKDAQALLAEYAHARGVVIKPPIAIDDIIEKYPEDPATRRWDRKTRRDDVLAFYGNGAAARVLCKT